MERLGGAHRILAGQAVGHQQRLGRLGDPAISAASLIIASSRVVRPAVSSDQHVVAAEPGGQEGRAAGQRVAAPPGRHDDRQALDLGLLGLVIASCSTWRPGGGCRGGDQHLLPLGLGEAQRQLAGHGGLAGAPQPAHQDHRRRVPGQPQGRGLLAAQHRDKAVVDDLDHLDRRGFGPSGSPRLAGGRGLAPWR